VQAVRLPPILKTPAANDVLVASIVPPLYGSELLPISRCRLGSAPSHTADRHLSCCQVRVIATRWQLPATLRCHCYDGRTQRSTMTPMTDDTFPHVARCHLPTRVSRRQIWRRLLLVEIWCRSPLKQYLTPPIDVCCLYLDLHRLNSILASDVSQFGWRTFVWHVWCAAVFTKPGNRIRSRRRWRIHLIQRLLIDKRLL